MGAVSQSIRRRKSSRFRNFFRFQTVGARLAYLLACGLSHGRGIASLATGAVVGISLAKNISAGRFSRAQGGTIMKQPLKLAALAILLGLTANPAAAQDKVQDKIKIGVLTVGSGEKLRAYAQAVRPQAEWHRIRPPRRPLHPGRGDSRRRGQRRCRGRRRRADHRRGPDRAARDRRRSR